MLMRRTKVPRPSAVLDLLGKQFSNCSLTTADDGSQPPSAQTTGIPPNLPLSSQQPTDFMVNVPAVLLGVDGSGPSSSNSCALSWEEVCSDPTFNQLYRLRSTWNDGTSAAQNGYQTTISENSHSSNTINLGFMQLSGQSLYQLGAGAPLPEGPGVSTRSCPDGPSSHHVTRGRVRSRARRRTANPHTPKFATYHVVAHLPLSDGDREDIMENYEADDELEIEMDDPMDAEWDEYGRPNVSVPSVGRSNIVFGYWSRCPYG